MDQHKSFPIAGVITGIIAIILISLTALLITKQTAKGDRYKEYASSIVTPSSDNGNIGDHIKGSADAPVIVFEYADFQCPGCASINAHVNTAVEEAAGRLAVVYRNYLLSYHQNATAAASAAEAAGLQGYWKPYADLLFKNQADWEYASASERTTLFNEYFTEVTDGQGDLAKFNQDLASENVSKKISFDMTIGKYVDIPGTPAFYVDGQFIDWGNSKGGKVVVNGKTLEWNHVLSGSEFKQLLLDIVEAKTSN